jgi:hypothetical protein
MYEDMPLAYIMVILLSIEVLLPHVQTIIPVAGHWLEARAVAAAAARGVAARAWKG